MARFIPEHPQKGSPEAFAWAEKMRKARKGKTARQIRRRGKITEREFFGPGAPLDPRYPPLKRRLTGNNVLANPRRRTYKRNLQIQCAWCGKSLGEKAPYDNRNVSHGICAACDKQVRAEIAGMKPNPGVVWHEDAQSAAVRYRKKAETEQERLVYTGMVAAHQSSASAARKLGMNPKHKKNPLAVFGLGNPERFNLVCTANGCTFLRQGLTKTDANLKGSNHANSAGHSVAVVHTKKPKRNPQRQNCFTIAGTVYNQVKEIRAEKTIFKPGLYKHPFKNGVKLLALEDGSLLVKSTTGKALWERV